MDANEKLMMKDEELDMISGGTTWTCERTNIGSRYERITFVSVTHPEPGYTKTVTRSFGLADALDFMDKNKGDAFQTADGKAFTLD